MDNPRTVRCAESDERARGTRRAGMPRPWPTTEPTAAHRAAYADAKVASFWLDDLPPRDPHPPLAGTTDADLVIVGGGFTGLWAALHAKRDAPERDVVVLEADVVGGGASGRNGGFMVASLTHGLWNGLARFEDEMRTLERLAFENFEGIQARSRGLQHRRRVRADRRAGRDARAARGRGRRGGGRAAARLRPRRRRPRRERDARRGRLPHLPRRRLGPQRRRRWCIRPSWPTGCAPRRCARASGSSSTRRRRRCTPTGAR